MTPWHHTECVVQLAAKSDQVKGVAFVVIDQDGQRNSNGTRQGFSPMPSLPSSMSSSPLRWFVRSVFVLLLFVDHECHSPFANDACILRVSLVFSQGPQV